MEGRGWEAHIQWRCPACGAEMASAFDQLYAVRFEHGLECGALDGRVTDTDGRSLSAAEVASRLAFVCSGELPPLGVDSQKWLPTAAGHLREHPELFTPGPFPGPVPMKLEIMRDAMVDTVTETDFGDGSE